jgi:RNA polymerase sigma-70 factor (ECF subfamily)
MEDKTTRRSLLARVRDTADHAAWSAFVSQYRELVRRFARARGLQESDADDICQLVFAKLSRALRTFDYDPTKGRFRGYLYRIVKNEIIQQFGRPNRPEVNISTTGQRAESPEDDRTLEALWQREWENHHLRLAMHAVQERSDERSIAVFERLLAGATIAQVAGEMEMTSEAVHKIKQRMRRRLETQIAQQIEDEDNPDRLPGPENRGGASP